MCFQFSVTMDRYLRAIVLIFSSLSMKNIKIVQFLKELSRWPYLIWGVVSPAAGSLSSWCSTVISYLLLDACFIDGALNTRLGEGKDMLLAIESINLFLLPAADLLGCWAAPSGSSLSRRTPPEQNVARRNLHFSRPEAKLSEGRFSH